MKEGNFKGKITNYGILGQETKADGSIKAMQAFITFNVDFGESTKTMTHFLGFKSLQPGKKMSQAQVSGQIILDCGFTGNSIAEMAHGVAANLFPTDKDFNISVEPQTDQFGATTFDTSGNPKFKIKSVFNPDKGGFKTQIDYATAQAQVAQSGADQILLRLKNQNTAAPQVQQPAPQVQPPLQNQNPSPSVNQQFAADDIPF